MSNPNKCDVRQPPAYITTIDNANAYKYARKRLLFEKTQALKAPVVWQDMKVDYPCPTGLTCYNGYPKISTQKECESRSVYDVNKLPGTKGNTGFYLVWRSEDKPEEGNCYLGNYGYRRECDTNFSRPPKDQLWTGPSKFYWDSTDPNGGKCLMTSDYCQKPSTYHPSSRSDGFGGSCELSTGDKIAEALFGRTITSFFNGNCPAFTEAMHNL